MSGNRPGDDGNRRRNLSVASNASSSSCKDNTYMNHRVPVTEQRRQSRPSTEIHQVITRDNGQRFQYSMNPSSFRSSQQRPAGSHFAEVSSASNSQPEGDQQEAKRQYENIVAQIQQLHPTFMDEMQQPTTIQPDAVADTSVYVNRAIKLREAQQRLRQLQELMQNVSIDLDCNPYSHLVDTKSRKPKDFPMDFLKNLSSSGSARTTSIPRINPQSTPRQPNGSQRHQRYSPTQQNNLSQESISPKRLYSSSQANGSLLDVFPRSEPSFDSSDADENPIGVDEEDNMPDVNSSQDPLIQHEAQNNSYRAPLVSPPDVNFSTKKKKKMFTSFFHVSGSLGQN